MPQTTVISGDRVALQALQQMPVCLKTAKSYFCSIVSSDFPVTTIAAPLVSAAQHRHLAPPLPPLPHPPPPTSYQQALRTGIRLHTHVARCPHVGEFDLRQASYAISNCGPGVPLKGIEHGQRQATLILLYPCTPLDAPVGSVRICRFTPCQPCVTLAPTILPPMCRARLPRL